MFQYSTSTIINSDKDIRSDKALFSSVAADEKHGAILRIKRDFTFEMPNIKKVYKREGFEAKKAEATIDFEQVLKAIPAKAEYPIVGRLAIYVALEGSEESIFANDFYQKGHPFSVGFLVKNEDTTATEVATAVKNALVKFNTANIGRKVFDVTSTGSVVTLKATEEYSRFKAIAALRDLGDNEEEIVHYIEGELDNEQTAITIVERGVNGFGTFRHLVKDLRLPTNVALEWTAIGIEERPIPTALYNQYIVYYEAPSQTNPSLVAIGHQTTSKTSHSFWVKQDIAPAFEAVIAEVVGADAAKDSTAIFEEV